MGQLIRIDGGGETIVLELRPGPPRLVYWDARLAPGTPLLDVARLATGPVVNVGFDDGEAFDLVPETGRGFVGHPAVICHRDDGRFITQLAFEGFEAGPHAAEIRLADRMAGVGLAMTVELDAETGVATFGSRLSNLADGMLEVDWLAPAALPLPGDEALFFDGRWAHEFRPVRERVRSGLLMKENRAGRTSHHAPPFAVAGEAGFSEEKGRVLGAHLAWSGDARVFVERLRDGRLQLQAGELFWPGELRLSAGESYETPRLYAARSDTGLGGLSDRFHPFVRHGIMGGRLAARPRLVHFNSWEAVYFRHELEELKALADTAQAIGAERFVLDDGWFKGRNDDRAGLGDWTPDPAKYPEGLAPFIAHVHALGLEFGLWVEPEMANADSDLLRANPDWVLGEAGRRQPLGRGQYVLDLSRPEVTDHLFGVLDGLLAANDIQYLKWDMNRDLSHAASGGRPSSHKQTLAVYALIDRVRAAHPGVEIESCSSGGGRADYEILKRTDRIWTSDCHDPHERQPTQAGFSIFFPPEVMGAHVGASPDHTTHRRTSVALRAITALFGHLGVETDVRAFSPRDAAALTGWIATYKAQRALIHGGRSMRLDMTDPGAMAVMVTDGRAALVAYAQLQTPATALLAPLRPRGLGPDAVYELRRTFPPPRPLPHESPAFADGVVTRLSGRAIEAIGLPLPQLRAGEAALFQLDRID